MRYRVCGTVDDDQVLSLRFGDALKESMPKSTENLLCEIFWDGDMQTDLIKTFGANSNEPIDFELLVETTDDFAGKVVLVSVVVGNWKLDPIWLAEQLGPRVL